MIVIEFYMKSAEEAFDVLCYTFFTVADPILRKVDGSMGAAVYSVSRNPKTGWVQLLVDDHVTEPILNAIKARVKGLSDTGDLAEYVDERDNISPIERARKEVRV